MTSNGTAGGSKKVLIALAIPALTLGIVGLVSVYPTATNQGYAPEQPIPFSHKIHAGTHKIACLYCHSGAEKSRHATIPSLSVCINCHSVVKIDSPHVQKVRQHWMDKKPIEWVRVHELADYVYFPHKRHVAKGVACETCHGDVRTMDKIEQKFTMTMGWCLDCHRGVTTPKNVLAAAPKTGDGHSQVATTNCSACHN